jgi:CHAD domain-containing protein
MAAPRRQPVRQSRAETPDQSLRRMLAGQIEVVRANEPRARRGSVKGLHDIRVALCRMRTLAAVFAPLDKAFLAQLDKRASKVCDRMGDARDLDVWIELFGDLEAARGLDEIPLRERRAVRKALREARTRLAAAALDCGGFGRVKKLVCERLRERLPHRTKPPPSVGALAARRMLTVRGMIEERHRRVGAFSSKLAHDLRRSGRRLRYLSEFFAEGLGPDCVRAGGWITRAQAALGKMHDCDNALELSTELPTGKARAAVRRGLKKRRAEHLAKFKVAWRHYASRRLQDGFLRRLEAAAAES